MVSILCCIGIKRSKRLLSVNFIKTFCCVFLFFIHIHFKRAQLSISFLLANDLVALFGLRIAFRPKIVEFNSFGPTIVFHCFLDFCYLGCVHKNEAINQLNSIVSQKKFKINLQSCCLGIVLCRICDAILTFSWDLQKLYFLCDAV